MTERPKVSARQFVMVLKVAATFDRVDAGRIIARENFAYAKNHLAVIIKGSVTPLYELHSKA